MHHFLQIIYGSRNTFDRYIQGSYFLKKQHLQLRFYAATHGHVIGILSTVVS